jgi:hypothetical protein
LKGIYIFSISFAQSITNRIYWFGIWYVNRYRHVVQRHHFFPIERSGLFKAINHFVIANIKSSSIENAVFFLLSHFTMHKGVAIFGRVLKMDEVCLSVLDKQGKEKRVCVTLAHNKHIDL